MELRYLGFDQIQNARAYRYDLIVKGQATRHCIVTVDLELFRTYHLGIQEGPSICGNKLLSELETGTEVAFELTVDDLRKFAEARAAEQARKLESRKRGPRRTPTSPETSQAPWRDTRV